MSFRRSFASRYLTTIRVPASLSGLRRPLTMEFLETRVQPGAMLFAYDFDPTIEDPVLGSSDANNFGLDAMVDHAKTQGSGLHAADANMDGRFDKLDIVQVAQAGKYLTGQTATFAQGDFNGDGVFDQFDIVAALVTNNYRTRPFAMGGPPEGRGGGDPNPNFSEDFDASHLLPPGTADSTIGHVEAGGPYANVTMAVRPNDFDILHVRTENDQNMTLHLPLALRAAYDPSNKGVDCSGPNRFADVMADNAGNLTTDPGHPDDNGVLYYMGDGTTPSMKLGSSIFYCTEKIKGKQNGLIFNMDDNQVTIERSGSTWTFTTIDSNGFPGAGRAFFYQVDDGVHNMITGLDEFGNGESGCRVDSPLQICDPLTGDGPADDDFMGFTLPVSIALEAQEG